MPKFDRRTHPREHFRFVWDLIYRGLRLAAGHVNNFRLAVGAFVLAGGLLAVLGTWFFSKFAGEVREGDTQAFDDAVMHWVKDRRHPWLEHSAAEVTMLGTGVVVLMIVGVAAMFLWLTRHRYSAILLLIATGGGIVLNNILKLYFHRPRPQVFEWGTQAMSSSFPSGHAMSATIVYLTVAYLAARLQKRRWARWLTMLVALAFVVLISLTRVYLGVHYPSDVAAGALVGLSWAGFCMATLEAVQRFATRREPQVAQDEEPVPARAPVKPETAMEDRQRPLTAGG
ncbi:MAG: phosphatase PAP2 family protein [Gemmatimonadaceae bacterium]